MEIVRCGSCNRKLAEGEFTCLSIKCSRCGTMNILKAFEPLIRKPGASDHEVNYVKANHSLAGRQTSPS
ncbi:Com family DNA-binding transcriptional regulator [Methylomonas paludis]|uniref:Com family DNA-binding transcriptional regulator n=1 Tax=Methylomonas paludis TaxID=1173101 RepID=A0A975MRA9_9GAMM|nr:Com family DNA-binding transcriptional regulator [Methylomonas paludis]